MLLYLNVQTNTYWCVEGHKKKTFGGLKVSPGETLSNKEMLQLKTGLPLPSQWLTHCLPY